MRRVPVGLAVIALACTGAPRSVALDAAHAAAIRDSVTAWMEQVPADLMRGGPMTWLDHFADTPGFSMASDGAVAFPSYDSAAVFLHDFAPTVAQMDLVWADLRVEPLAPGFAAVAAAYAEQITDTAGAVVQFGGYVTGTAIHAPGGWRLLTLHWSSPAADPGVP